MLYDLNVPWTPDLSTDKIARILNFSASLGYNVVALNHTIVPPIPPIPQNPVPKVTHSPGDADSSAPPPSPSAAPPTQGNPPRIQSVLRRATVVLSDPSCNYRVSALTPLYDLVAVRPVTAASFQHTCLTFPDTTLVSLDLTTRLAFPLRPRLVTVAIARGLRFEICYAHAISGSGGDPQARVNFITNMANLVRASRGRGIVVASGASSPLWLRAPADVVNLMAVWGLGPERGLEGLGVVPRAVVVNEGIRRTGFRGVVDIVETVHREEDTQLEKKDEEGRQQNQKQKRKNGEQDGGGGGEEGGAGVMSKRQAKRMKLAAKRGAREMGGGG